MVAQWENERISLFVLPVAQGSITDHGGVFKGIFPWLITRAALYTVQGVPKSGVVPPWKNTFNLMKIMRCLGISLVVGKKSHGLELIQLNSFRKSKSFCAKFVNWQGIYLAPTLCKLMQ